MIQTSCAICGSLENFEVLYPANFKEDDFNTSIFSARRLPDRVHYQIVRCQKDGLIRSNPILEPEKLEQLYKISKFTYIEELANLTKTYMQVLKKVLNSLKSDAKILEIGCGNGFLLNYLYQNGYTSVFGVEPSKDAVNKASEKIKVNIKVDVFKKNLFKVNSFDFIFFFQTFDHVHNPNEFLKEAFRILKPGGYILSFNHDIESFQAKLFKSRSPIIDIEHTYLYSPKTMKQIFEKNGFKVVDIYPSINYISIKHLVWLLPLPKNIKLSIINGNILKGLLKLRLGLNLGNVVLTARKN